MGTALIMLHPPIHVSDHRLIKNDGRFHSKVFFSSLPVQHHEVLIEFVENGVKSSIQDIPNVCNG